MSSSTMAQRVAVAINAQRNELWPALAGFTLFFCLFSGYFMLRPIREAMGIVSGVENLQWLFTATFVVMLLAIPLFGWVAARAARRRIQLWTYGFFALNLVAFAVVFVADPENAWAGRTFYVWLSVFNLISISVAWSVLADLFSMAQAKRVFALMAATVLARLRVEEPGPPAVSLPVFASIAQGARFVWNNQIMLGAMALDMFSVLLGGVVAMLPAFIHDILHYGPEGLGILRAAPAMGSICVGVWLARRPLQEHAGRVLFFAVAATRVLGFPEVTEILNTVLEVAGGILLGGAIIAAGPQLDLGRFRAYSASRDYAKEFPGIRGYGYIQRGADGYPLRITGTNNTATDPLFLGADWAPADNGYTQVARRISSVIRPMSSGWV